MLDEPKKASCCPNMTPFILMIALSVHSLFEGLALGLTKEEKDVVNIVIAILVHKGAAGCSLGIALTRSFPEDKKLCVQLVTVFSAATPIGVGIGMAIANAGDIYDVIFSSIAAGTFIYIACTEMVVHEFSVAGNRYWKFAAFFFGATFINLLWLMPGS